MSGVIEGRQDSEIESVGELNVVECLKCGSLRTSERERTERLSPGECQSCGYLGWAAVSDLSDSVRRVLRERPPEDRHGRPHLFAV
jgi:Zn ribbon nucleic-acid-binding protein